MRAASHEVMSRHPDPGKLCAVIVSYHPDDSFVSRVERIAGQTRKVFLVDNATTGPACKAVDAAAQISGVEILRSKQNQGVAGGLNTGVNKALQEGFEWALLFDQDTLPNKDLAGKLLSLWNKLPDQMTPAVLGCNYIDQHRNHPALRCPEGAAFCEQKAVIISGTLLSLAAYKATGPFREAFFMDLVDTDFCYRARRQGFGVYAACEPLMQHAVGCASSHSFLGHRVWMTNHPAWRRYLMARNSMILHAEYGKQDRFWLLRTVMKQFKKSIYVLLFEKDSMPKVAAMWRGIQDGIRRHMDFKPWEKS